jgi:tetratricopeptide (TPR) repeat protein
LVARGPARVDRRELRASLSAAFAEEFEPTGQTVADPTPTGPRRKVRRPDLSVDVAGSDDPVEPPSFRADLEELLPLVSTKSSMPPLPAMPELSAQRPRPHDPRWTRFSLAIFGAMLAASALPLARYAGLVSSNHAGRPPAIQLAMPVAPSEPRPIMVVVEARGSAGEQSQETGAQPGVQLQALPADPMLAALERVEGELASDAVTAADQLLAHGLKALAAGDQRFAEALFGRALKLDDDNPRAYYGLAQIRLAEGNLQGAEGWILAALRKRPRRAEYHSLYARLLEGLGRPEEARAAHERAAELRAR